MQNVYRLEEYPEYYSVEDAKTSHWDPSNPIMTRFKINVRVCQENAFQALLLFNLKDTNAPPDLSDLFHANLLSFKHEILCFI